ncbi:hypothetical protein SNEBB_010721 [Seison nebaliae]|nr:hypothetical protein SNEBB_010721 [Seison nebaliae]
MLSIVELTLFFLLCSNVKSTSDIYHFHELHDLSSTDIVRTTAEHPSRNYLIGLTLGTLFALVIIDAILLIRIFSGHEKNVDELLIQLDTELCEFLSAIYWCELTEYMLRRIKFSQEYNARKIQYGTMTAVGIYLSLEGVKDKYVVLDMVARLTTSTNILRPKYTPIGTITIRQSPRLKAEYTLTQERRPSKSQHVLDLLTANRPPRPALVNTQTVTLYNAIE